LQKTHIYGTPTVFINNTALIGLKPYRVYERTLKGWKFGSYFPPISLDLDDLSVYDIYIYV